MARKPVPKLSTLISQVSTNDLLPGMVVIRFVNDEPRIDAKLKAWSSYAGSCNGKHFVTESNSSVCYLPGGRVHILT